MDRERADSHLPLSAIDFQVLVVLGRGEQYGYAIMKAVAEESDGALTPEIGSLYRVLARLVSRKLVEDVPTDPTSEVHPGRARKYYRLTALGRDVVRAEAARLRAALALADGRDLLPGGGP